MKNISLPQLAPTEKKFFFLFFWTSLLPIVLLFIVGYYTTANIIQKEALAKQVALVEQRHSEVALFARKLESRTIAWGTDGYIRELSQKINDGACDTLKKTSAKICPAARQLSDYLARTKLPLNSSIGIIDILNLDGVVVASSDSTRIGIDEHDQEISFSAAKALPFGQATFFPKLVSEEEEFDRRMMVHTVTPIASIDSKKLIGVLLAHTESTELEELITKNNGNGTQTYLVDNGKIVIGPTRLTTRTLENNNADSPPANECALHNASFSGAYRDYRNAEVFGASKCDINLFGALVVETEQSKIFIEINKLRNIAGIILLVVLLLVIGYAYISGTNLIRGARHLLPGTLTNTLTLSIIMGIIILATMGISFVFAQNIKNFIINQKTSIVSSLITQQAERHLNHVEYSVFTTWKTPESQQKFNDFAKEILRSFHAVVELNLHTPEGMLIWSTTPSAQIGAKPKAGKIAQTLSMGTLVTSVGTSSIETAGTSDFIEVYTPIFGQNGKIFGVVETDLDAREITTFTQNIQKVLWAGALVALILIFSLLRFILRYQETKIATQARELSAIIEQSPIGIHTVSKTGIIERLNPVIAGEVGVSDTQELLGKNVFELNYYRASGLDNLIREGLSGTPFEKELEILTPHSLQKTYHHYYGIPLKNTDDQIDRILLMSEDITERKRLEKEVHEYSQGLEGEYRGILETLDKSAIVSITDKKGNITYANQKFIEISKYTHEELMGQNHRILKSGEQPQQLFVEMWATISSGNTWRGEIKNKAKDGTFYWVDSTITPILGSDGKPKHYVALRIVITERKLAEEAVTRYLKYIEKSEALNEALLANLGEGMLATDNEGRIITVNPLAEKMLGWTKTELTGKLVTDAIPAINEAGDAVPREKRACFLVSRDGNTATLMDTLYFIKKDGGKIPVAVTATPVIIDNNHSGAVIIFRDITREKELEKTRQDLLALASHQLRTPLSGTKWLIETLKKGIHGTLTKNQEEYLDQIYKINERMTSLVGDMLGVLRMEGESIKSKKEQVELSSVFKALFDASGSAATSKGVTLRLTENQPHTIATDPLLLRNILECIVSNAINYSPKGSEVLVSVEEKTDALTIIVKDSGIGIPRDEQRQIFERFYRASNAKTYDTHGSGLGLYIAATLAKKIGAQLSFESKDGTGTTFYVNIPYTEKAVLPETASHV